MNNFAAAEQQQNPPVRKAGFVYGFGAGLGNNCRIPPARDCGSRGNFMTNADPQHEIQRLKERVTDLERQLAQEEASHLTEVEILKHDLTMANLKTRLQLQDEIAERREN